MITKGVAIACLIGIMEVVAIVVSVIKTEKRWNHRLGIFLNLAFLAGLAIFLCYPYARKDLFLTIVLCDIALIFTLLFYIIMYMLIDTIEFAAHEVAHKKSVKERKELIEKLEKEGKHDQVYNLLTAEWKERYGNVNSKK